MNLLCRVVLAVLLFFPLVGSAAVFPGPLYVGVSRKTIVYTFQGTDQIGGGLGQQFYTGIDSPSYPNLTVSALVISDGNNKVMLISIDALAMKAVYQAPLDVPGDGMDMIATGISFVTGVPAGNILINATHTHHAPSTVKIHGNERMTNFCIAVRDAAISAGIAAFNGMQDADVYFGRVANYYGENSRKISDEGWIRFAWDNPVSWVDSSASVDGELSVLSFRKTIGTPGEPIATVFTHNMHNYQNLNGNAGQISPDVYGIAALQLSSEGLGTTFFLSGASGSNHNLGAAGQANVNSLKASVTSAYDSARKVENPTVSAIKQQKTYSYRKIVNAPGQGEEKLVGDYLARWGQSGYASVFANQRTDLLGSSELPRTTWIQGMRIGDIYIAALPGEVFARLGTQIKLMSPANRTIVLGLSNDYVGYLPDQASFSYVDPTEPGAGDLKFAKGGYQTWVGHHSPMAPGTGEQMRDDVLGIITTLGATAPTPDGMADYVIPWKHYWRNRCFAVFRSLGDGTFDQYYATESRSSDLAPTPGYFNTFLPGKYPPEHAKDFGALVDVTGDGRKDYVTVLPDSQGKRHFVSYIAQANGRFSDLIHTEDLLGTYLPDADGKDRGVFADVNGDGRLDYVVVWMGPQGQRNLATYLAQGDGHFAQYVNTLDVAGAYVADAQGWDMGRFADINGDGRTDYIVVWKGAGNKRNLATFLAQANGTFAQSVNTLDQAGLWVADSIGRDKGLFADVNGDGRADYVVIYAGAGNVRAFATFLGQANGTFAQFVSSSDPQSQFVPDTLGRDSGDFSDVNNDGKADYVVVYPASGNRRAFATYIANPNGTFQVSYLKTETSDVRNVDAASGRDMGRFCRVTSDPYPDYVVVYPVGSERRFLTYKGIGNGQFELPGKLTIDRAGTFLGSASVSERGHFGDVR